MINKYGYDNGSNGTLSNKEKARHLFSVLTLAIDEYNNSLDWEFPKAERIRREKRIRDIKNQILELIPD